MLGNAENAARKLGEAASDQAVAANDADVHCHTAHSRDACGSGTEKYMKIGGGMMNKLVREFPSSEEDGLGTVEIVVIIAVLVGIALIFRDAIIKFVTDIMKSIFAGDSITNDVNIQSLSGKDYTTQIFPLRRPSRGFQKVVSEGNDHARDCRWHCQRTGIHV